MPPRDYARLHFDWYRDDVLETIAAEEPAALWIWPVLIGMAKEKSHAATNPTGAFEKSAAGIGKAAHVPAEQVQRALDLLVEGEFITAEPSGKLGTLRIELSGFEKWQTPRAGGAEREQKRRDASREKAASRDGSVTPPLRSVIRETETETEDQALSFDLSDEPVQVGVDPLIRPVFDAWRDKFGRNANTKLNAKRKARIRWALDQYGKEAVWHVIVGYASDPWRHETVSRNEIAVLLRDDANVEKGLELYAKSRGQVKPTSAAPRRNTLEEMGYA